MYNNGFLEQSPYPLSSRARSRRRQREESAVNRKDIRARPYNLRSIVNSKGLNLRIGDSSSAISKTKSAKHLPVWK
ncbi:hypothetical protein TNCV_3764141 [Trichonephila clavipes]|uniref:Uncharacterized protein n=1 Tax=Trichonephila clavipes TaxID=2585209 RepID=A0A8X6VVD6_TRICX|nr:hypothetical protein TNCV_3764141 [Trichonephila clavipes]